MAPNIAPDNVLRGLLVGLLQHLNQPDAEPNSSPASLNVSEMPSEQNTKTSPSVQFRRPSRRRSEPPNEPSGTPGNRWRHLAAGAPDRVWQPGVGKASRVLPAQVEHRVAQRAVILLELPLVQDAVDRRQHRRPACLLRPEPPAERAATHDLADKRRCRARPALPCPRRRRPKPPACSARGRENRRRRRPARGRRRNARPRQRRFSFFGSSCGSSASCTRCAKRSFLFDAHFGVADRFVQPRILDRDRRLRRQQRQQFHVLLVEEVSSGLSRSNTPTQRSFSSSGITSSERTSLTTLM